MSSKHLTYEQTAAKLLAAEDILLLAHQYPDGDTLGSCFGLCLALQHLGKRVRILCNDPIPAKYEYMTALVKQQDFVPQYICAVDVADSKLLGPTMQTYADKVDLCIDHHGTNVEYAKATLLDAECGAAAMLIFRLLPLLNVPLTTEIATCLYTGMVTDTGCFKYGNTTALTHEYAAQCIQVGVPYVMINRLMFDTKSRARIELERLALAGISFHFGGRVAVMAITNKMIADSGATENDLEGLPPLPRQIEGVWVGITMREQADGSYKISMRTGQHANAAELCKLLGGGGHAAAAGCRIDLPLNEAVAVLVKLVGENVAGIGE
ncbi:MAG: DHH family phosphoesterase [Clostridia bacterium]|nr:DHH family phosphoesterase [Clostridia bacterium]